MFVLWKKCKTFTKHHQECKEKSGDKVLIHAGSGGVGTFAIQYTKSKEAYVYATTSTKNVSWVKKLGVDRV